MDFLLFNNVGGGDKMSFTQELRQQAEAFFSNLRPSLCKGIAEGNWSGNN